MTSAVMHLGDARALPIPADTVDCIVTSPPYNVDLDYDDVDDALPLDDYRALAHASMREAWRVLKPGGRIWVNVVQATNTLGDYGRDTGKRHHLDRIWHEALTAAGLLYRDTVIWEKTFANQDTAWGSLYSPNAPNLRGRYEPILLYFKDHWKRGRDDGRSPDLDPAEWADLTRNVWQIQPDGRNRWHPAPFPTELPRRAILLSTWRGDLVVDPFAGAGTTLRTAHKLGRHAIGIELSPAYVDRWNDTGLQTHLELPA